MLEKKRSVNESHGTKHLPDHEACNGTARAGAGSLELEKAAPDRRGAPASFFRRGDFKRDELPAGKRSSATMGWQWRSAGGRARARAAGRAQGAAEAHRGGMAETPASWPGGRFGGVLVLLRLYVWCTTLLV